MNKPLLPSGLHDYLPPLAERESRIVGLLLAHFRLCGYEQVHPPLMEYEETLLGDLTALSTRSFRVMDPLSQRMMAIRADMTMQIARIAGSLMNGEPRPLRLCYGGQTLRTSPDALRTTRQYRQIGIECFGAEGIAADVEVIQTAIASVQALGLTDVTVDLNMPPLLDGIAAGLSAEDKTALVEAVRRKDHAAMQRFNLPVVQELSDIAGPADMMLKRLSKIKLPAAQAHYIDQLTQAYELLRARLGDGLAITLDPLEMHGFGYYTGLRFSLFLKSQRTEIGRGGRYRTPHGESATGFTLYTEDLLPFVTAADSRPRVLMSMQTTEAQAAHWREQGYVTLYAATDNVGEEAQKLQCRFTLDNNQLKAI